MTYPIHPASGDLERKLLLKLLDTLVPLAAVAAKFQDCPVVEISKPHPGNPSSTILPMPREWFERAADDLEAAAILLHARGVLSEGQASKITGLDRVSVREQVDGFALRPATPPATAAGVGEAVEAVAAIGDWAHVNPDEREWGVAFGTSFRPYLVTPEPDPPTASHDALIARDGG